MAFSKTTKAKILNRCNRTCQVCGYRSLTPVEILTDPSYTGRDIEVDHILARDNGGKDTGNNAIVLCAFCNGTKGNVIVDFNALETVDVSRKSLAEYEKNVGENRKIFYTFIQASKVENFKRYLKLSLDMLNGGATVKDCLKVLTKKTNAKYAEKIRKELAR